MKERIIRERETEDYTIRIERHGIETVLKNPLVSLQNA